MKPEKQPCLQCETLIEITSNDLADSKAKCPTCKAELRIQSHRTPGGGTQSKFTNIIQPKPLAINPTAGRLLKMAIAKHGKPAYSVDSIQFFKVVGIPDREDQNKVLDTLVSNGDIQRRGGMSFDIL